MTVKSLNRMKRGRIDWAKDFETDYEKEKMLRHQRTHILVKESEFKQVQRSINKFSKKCSIEFDTVFKMYKIQNYSLTTKLFRGSSYKYGTLSSIRNLVKSATVTDKPFSTNNWINSIFEFITEIKSCSKPFPYVFKEMEGRKNAIDLINTGTLTFEEKEFLLQPIKSKRVARSDNERDTRKVVKKVKEKIMKKNETKEQQRNTIYSLIISNYKRKDAAKYIKSELQKNNIKISSSTLLAYLSACRVYEKKHKVTTHCPKSLIDMCDKHLNKLNVNNLVTTGIVSTVQDKYLLVNNNEIVKSGNSLDFLKGYKEASGIEMKIYQIVD